MDLTELERTALLKVLTNLTVTHMTARTKTESQPLACALDMDEARALMGVFDKLVRK